MNIFKRLFGKGELSADARQVSVPSLTFQGDTLVEQALDRVESHEKLAPLLTGLHAV